MTRHQQQQQRPQSWRISWVRAKGLLVESYFVGATGTNNNELCDAKDVWHSAASGAFARRART